MAEYKVVDAEKLDAELKSLADKIREKGGTTEELDFYEGDFTNAVGAIESGGGGTEEIEQIIDQSGVLDSTEGTVEDKVEQLIDKAEWENSFYEAFEWLNQTVNNMFANCTFKRAPKINPINIPNAPYWYNACLNMKLFDFYFNGEKVKNYNSFLNRCSSLEFFEGANTSEATTISAFCAGCISLHTINQPFDFSKVTNASNFLSNCTSLINVSFVPETIKVSISFTTCIKLSGNSVQNIFDGLDPSVTGKTLTLPSAFENEEAEAVVSANIEVVDGVTRIKGKEGWTLVR